jgi:hypothetical protein
MHYFALRIHTCKGLNVCGFLSKIIATKLAIMQLCIAISFSLQTTVRRELESKKMEEEHLDDYMVST